MTACAISNFLADVFSISIDYISESQVKSSLFEWVIQAAATWWYVMLFPLMQAKTVQASLLSAFVAVLSSVCVCLGPK